MPTAKPLLRRHLLRSAALLCLLACGGTATADSSAVEKINEFHDTLLEVMQGGDSLGFQGRYDTLKPIIENNFDTPLIARVVLGRYWQELGDEQKQRFIETFSELSIATYASRFNNYDGEQFEYIGTEPLNKGRILVQTHMVTSDGDTVRFDYLMHQREGNWYIMSVVVRGVNDLSLKRAEYTSIMESQGYDALIRNLQDKIASLRAE